MPSNILQFTMKTLICNTFWKLFSSLVKNAILTTSATNLKIQQVKSNTSERKRELSSVPSSLNLTPGTLSQILSIYKTPWTFQRTGEKKFNFFRYLTSQHHTLKSHKCMPCTSVRQIYEYKTLSRPEKIFTSHRGHYKSAATDGIWVRKVKQYPWKQNQNKKTQK